jgi:hypothetical protein
VHRGYNLCALADGSGNALDRPRTDIADGEYADTWRRWR